MLDRKPKELSLQERLKLVSPKRRRLIEALEEVRARRVGKYLKTIEDVNRLLRSIRGGSDD